jgi:sulfide:quinone oxidoreductase
VTATRSFPILIVGGGSGGLGVAARLAAVLPPGSVAVVEPSEKHYYQPLWTLVGGGVFPKEVTERDEADYIPDGRDLDPRSGEAASTPQSVVTLASGERLGYEQLVVAPGIQLDWHKIDGARGNVGKDGVCSNYRYDLVDSTWKFLDGRQAGNAIFTFPSTPVKCAGAPQKIMYLADDHLRRRGVRATKVIWASASPRASSASSTTPRRCARSSRARGSRRSTATSWSRPRRRRRRRSSSTSTRAPSSR